MAAFMRRRANRLAGASVIATVALFIAGNALRGATPTRLISPRDLLVIEGWWIRLSPLYALAFALVGALIVARRPGNRIGWVASGIGLLTAVYEFGLGYETFGPYVNGSLPALGFVRWLEQWEWALPVVLMLPPRRPAPGRPVGRTDRSPWSQRRATKPADCAGC
jgi:hypothetical protein